MARIKDRRKAIELRRRAKADTEIGKEVGVAKSSLSDWFSKYSLTESQLAKLRKTVGRNEYSAAEKTRLTKFKKREGRLKRRYQAGKEKLLPLGGREFQPDGLFFYWGEGTKGLRRGLSLNNNDLKLIKFFYLWLRQALEVSRGGELIVSHFYLDMDIEKSLNFWSKEMKIPRRQFTKP